MIYNKTNKNYERIRRILRRIEFDIQAEMEKVIEEDLSELIYKLDDIILLKYYVKEQQKELEELRNGK